MKGRDELDLPNEHSLELEQERVRFDKCCQHFTFEGG